MLEAYGDHVLNTALFDILWERYPDLDQGTITAAFQKAKAEEILSLEGKRCGFFEHIVASREYMEDALNWRDNCGKDNFHPVNENENVYIKLLEDTIESFCGALCKAVNKYSKCYVGTGAEIVYKWAITIIDGLPFDPTDKEQTKNIKQQLKEFWDVVYAQEVISGNKMQNNFMFIKDAIESRPGRIVMYAVDPNPNVRRDKKRISRAIGYNIDNARLEAAKIAFPIIKREYAEQYAKGLAFKSSIKK